MPVVCLKIFSSAFFFFSLALVSSLNRPRILWRKKENGGEKMEGAVLLPVSGSAITSDLGVFSHIDTKH